jgi:hypothetical protein
MTGKTGGSRGRGRAQLEIDRAIVAERLGGLSAQVPARSPQNVVGVTSHRAHVAAPRRRPVMRLKPPSNDA